MQADCDFSSKPELLHSSGPDLQGEQRPKDEPLEPKFDQQELQTPAFAAIRSARVPRRMPDISETGPGDAASATTAGSVPAWLRLLKPLKLFGSAKRFKTMDFAPVPADSPDWCPKCEKPRKERLAQRHSHLQLRSFTSQLSPAASGADGHFGFHSRICLRKDRQALRYQVAEMTPTAPQAAVMDSHAKKIETILWTKWPLAALQHRAAGRGGVKT